MEIAHSTVSMKRGVSDVVVMLDIYSIRMGEIVKVKPWRYTGAIYEKKCWDFYMFNEFLSSTEYKKTWLIAGTIPHSKFIHLPW